MCKTAEYRYAKRKGVREKQFNIHIREMIEMLKNEKVKENIDVRHVRVSNHALLRMKQHFGVSDMDSATIMARNMLRYAYRIGTILSYDGRISVLYAYRQTAFFMSPDLKTLVTVNRYPKVTYHQLLDKVNQGENRHKLIEMHLRLLEDIERKEKEYVEKILSIEERVGRTTEQLVGFLDLMRGSRKRNLKSIISEMNNELKIEGRKLFRLNVEKRHICKSLVALF